MTQATLSPGAGSPNEPLQFVGGVVPRPGDLFAAIRRGGRRRPARQRRPRRERVEDGGRAAGDGRSDRREPSRIRTRTARGSGAVRRGRPAGGVHRAVLQRRRDVESRGRDVRDRRQPGLAAARLAAGAARAREADDVARGEWRHGGAGAAARPLRRTRANHARRESGGCARPAVRAGTRRRIAGRWRRPPSRRRQSRLPRRCRSSIRRAR